MNVFNRGFTVGGFSPQVSLVREDRTSNAQLHDYERRFAELRFVRNCSEEPVQRAPDLARQGCVKIEEKMATRDDVAELRATDRETEPDCALGFAPASLPSPIAAGFPALILIVHAVSKGRSVPAAVRPLALRAAAAADDGSARHGKQVETSVFIQINCAIDRNGRVGHVCA